MFLKDALVEVVAPAQMKKRYGHDLKRLWRRFKQKEADGALDRFDSTTELLVIQLSPQEVYIELCYEKIRQDDVADLPEAAIKLRDVPPSFDANAIADALEPRVRNDTALRARTEWEDVLVNVASRSPA